jgi:hypothetical protein
VIVSVCEDVKKREDTYAVGEIINSTSNMANSMAFPQKIKNSTTI